MAQPQSHIDARISVSSKIRNGTKSSLVNPALSLEVVRNVRHNDISAKQQGCLYQERCLIV
jgi:hypothetical protein